MFLCSQGKCAEQLANLYEINILLTGTTNYKMCSRNTYEMK